MSQPITLEDIFQLFERQKEETERRAAEFERSLAASRAETDRRAAVTDPSPWVAAPKLGGSNPGHNHYTMVTVLVVLML